MWGPVADSGDGADESAWAESAVVGAVSAVVCIPGAVDWVPVSDAMAG